jgi:hypothetical protein
MLGEQIFVQGMREAAGTLHAYSVGGKHLRSFGEPYSSENPLVRSQLSDGRIGCSDDASTVVAITSSRSDIFEEICRRCVGGKIM